MSRHRRGVRSSGRALRAVRPLNAGNVSRLAQLAGGAP